METIRERLEEDLRTAVSRLRQMGGAVAVEELPGAIGDNSPYADEVDEIQANERREIGFATRELLVGRVNRLSAALERLRDGEYGTCVECEEPISPAVPGPDRAPRAPRRPGRRRARDQRRRLAEISPIFQRGRRTIPAPFFV
jgi:RNA polymerase-binding transcription factor DksA